MPQNDVFGYHEVWKTLQIFASNWDYWINSHPTVKENDELFKKALVVQLHMQVVQLHMHEFNKLLDEIIEKKFPDEK